MATQHATFCRFCHALCSIIATVEGGRVTKVIGNKDNAMYHGYTCIKGRSLPDQHSNPSRLLHSLKRGADGTHHKIPVEQAMDEVAEKLRAVIDHHGPRAVAMYLGTYGYHYPQTKALALGFMAALGSPMVFTPGSIDQPGKPMAVVFHGRWSAGPQSFDDADRWMVVGANPLVSMWGGIPHFNPARRLHQAKKRGLKLIVIDPRRTETAEKADLFIQPKPGEDPAIMAGIARVILEENLMDADFVREEAEGLDALRAALGPFTPDYVARRADVPAAQIIDAARLFASGTRGTVTCGTGPNMARHGTVVEYLALVMNTLCGRWLRAGEVLPNPFALLPQAEGKAQAEPRPQEPWGGSGMKMRVRNLRASATGLPTSAAAEEILTPGDGQIKVLLTVSGNPMAAWPDQSRTYEAFKKLELSLSVDIKLSATAKLCDYVIAPKMSFETPATTQSAERLMLLGVSPGFPKAYAQYTPALVEPPAGSDVIAEWEFFYGLAQRLGLQIDINGQPLNMVEKPTSDDLLEMMCAGSRIPLSDVKKYPGGHIFDDPPVLVKSKDANWPHKLHVGHPEMMAELAEIAAENFFDHAGYAKDDAFTHRLISRRMHSVYNSSGRDIPTLVREYSYNPAFMHPDDMKAAYLRSGDVIEIKSATASILGIVEEADDVRPGAISMAHGWGGAQEEDHLLRTQGSSTNRLCDATAIFDKRTGIPLMSAIPVRIRKVNLPAVE